MFARVSFCVLVASLLLVTLVLFARRLSGALVVPLDFLPALACGLSLAFGTWRLRRAALTVCGCDKNHVLLRTVIAITWLVVVSLTLSTMSPLAVLALWLPAIAAECAWQTLGGEGARGRVGEGGNGVSELSLSPPLPLTPSPAPLPPGVTQQLTRSGDSGGERITGLVRIGFEAGEQTAVLHLAICPPLERDPQVTMEIVDAEGVTVRATESRTYGVRLEAKRGRVAGEAGDVMVRIEIR